jgi:hypothetical protein
MGKDFPLLCNGLGLVAAVAELIWHVRLDHVLLRAAV